MEKTERACRVRCPHHARSFASGATPVSKLNVLSALLLRSPLLWGGALSLLLLRPDPRRRHHRRQRDPLPRRALGGVRRSRRCSASAWRRCSCKRSTSCGSGGSVDEQLLAPIRRGGQIRRRPATLAAVACPWRGRLRRYLPAPAAARRSTSWSAPARPTTSKTTSSTSPTSTRRGPSQSYGLVRFVIWAIPIMGFLGTVIGITVRHRAASRRRSSRTSPASWPAWARPSTRRRRHSRLSMVLMFLQFVIDRCEQRCSATVDDGAWTALAGRFQSLAGGDGTALAVARLGETLSRSSARLHRGAGAGLAGPRADGRGGPPAACSTRRPARSRRRCPRSLDDTLGTWATRSSHAQDDLAVRARGSLDAGRRVARDGGPRRSSSTSRRSPARPSCSQASSMRPATSRRSSGRSTPNLTTLAATGRFEETLATLAAAVQLLAARAGDAIGEPRRVDLQVVRRTGKAA